MNNWDDENPVCGACGEVGHYLCATLGKHKTDDQRKLELFFEAVAELWGTNGVERVERKLAEIRAR